ncbi:PAN domain-containing protein [Bradyrhizobium sp. JYMT SZCCT0180]|uniref:PAN domain-containing protein n=1 Tax=Bradyrhizobium sp. JYMT SZCCT0180 TaxID=2807666 RepID=UPI001BA5E031|nr:PAN domain-containing protein [Bradyrhizobium sp. JYMT SZCCT0180]MBR1214462.1 PAN domain-containing protein [Bradyrhizobium sp. JYMT SZCCT0180]
MSLRGLIVASALVVTFSGIAGTASAQGENFSRNTDRPGNDIRSIPFRGDAEACLKLCFRERECRAWTFVKAGFQGASPVCWIKHTIPRAIPNRCCTSGVIRRNL